MSRSREEVAVHVAENLNSFFFFLICCRFNISGENTHVQLVIRTDFNPHDAASVRRVQEVHQKERRK